jgi:hypothetical protein
VILGLSLFVGEAFLYNAVTFNLGTMLSQFFGVASGTVPVFIVISPPGTSSARRCWPDSSTRSVADR